MREWLADDEGGRDEEMEEKKKKKKLYAMPLSKLPSSSVSFRLAHFHRSIQLFTQNPL